MAPIRRGDGTGLDPKGYTEIRKADGTILWSAIPDSEADDKLIHRWVLDDVNGTVEDSIGDADGTVNGVTSVSGDYAGGSAGDGDGTDDYIETTTRGSFDKDREGGDFAYAFTIVPSDTLDDSMVSGVIDGAFVDSQYIGHIRLARNDEDGEIEFRELDDSANKMVVRSETGHLSNDSPARIVCNAVGNDANDWEIYIDQTDRTDVTADNDGLNDCVDTDHAFTLFARNEDGQVEDYGNFTLDDYCIYNDSLTQSEIESYENPWE